MFNEETYLEMKKTRKAIIEMCMFLYRENTTGDDGLTVIEERMVELLRKYDDIVYDYIMKKE